MGAYTVAGWVCAGIAGAMFLLEMFKVKLLESVGQLEIGLMFFVIAVAIWGLYQRWLPAAITAGVAAACFLISAAGKGDLGEFSLVPFGLLLFVIAVSLWGIRYHRDVRVA